MSFSTLVNRAGPYACNGTNRNWPYSSVFPIILTTDIQVWLIDSNDVATQITSNYEVDTGLGEVVYPTVASGLPPIATGNSILLIRILSLTQLIDLITQGSYNADTVEDMSDKVTMIAQQIQEQISRSILRPITESTPLELPALVSQGFLATNGAVLQWLSGITSTTYNGTILAGLDASKAASPTVNNIYVATDTKRVYICFSAGTWTITNHHYGLDANKAATPIVGEIYSSTDTEIVYICVVAGVWTEFSGSTKKTGQQNLLLNDSFEYWYAGISSAPDQWTLAGGGSVAREGTTKLIDTYAMKLTSDADGNSVSQSVHSRERGIAYWKNRYVTLAVWVYAADASNARIGIYDGVGTTYSSYHTGGSTWELLTVTRKVDAAATELTAQLFCDGNVKIGYFDGAMFSEGSTPYAYSPHPVIDTNHPAIAPNEDMKNLVVVLNSGTPATQVDIDADILQVEEYNLASINRTIDATGTGADGLDTGALANNTWYSAWVIYNPTLNLVAGLISTSETSPTMPTGYTKKRKVGHVRTGGTASFNDNGNVAESFGDHFHKRGNPSAWDWLVGTLTMDGSWHDLPNIANIVPDGAKGILFNVEVADDILHSALALREKGSSNDATRRTLKTHIANILNEGTFFLPCDSNRVVEYRGSAVVFIEVNVAVLGWYR